MIESAAEQRAPRGPRIPLDGLVELSHEGFDEAFEADGLNVGVGGLSMRATYLPDVGSRLSCRFPFPRLGVVEADAEVVWSHDKGPHTGEFGLRFVGLDPVSERVIRELVHGGGAYVPPSPSASEGADGTEDAVVEIDGVSSPIKAAIVAQDEDILSLAQELPFLRLKTGVTVVQDGRRGRIESVDLVMVDDVPRLLIDIVFEAEVVPGPSGDTIPDFVPVSLPANDTAVDVPAPTDVPASAPSVKSAAPRIVTASPKAVVVGTSIADIVAEPEPELDADAMRPPVLFDDVSDRIVLPPTIHGLIWLRLVALAAMLRAKSAPLRAAMREKLVVGKDRMVAFLGKARAEGLPAAKSALSRGFGRTSATMRILLAPVLARVGIASREKARRRTTAAPPLASNVTPRRARTTKEADAPVARPNRKRLAWIAALSVLGLSLVAWAVGAEDEPETPPLSITPPAPAPAPAAAPAPETPAPAAETAAPPSVPWENGAVPAAEPTMDAPVPAAPAAVAEPRRSTGPMPAPTFPSLREGARPAAPSTLPAGSPYGVDVREQGGSASAPIEAPAPASSAAWGAPSVPGGQSFLIRMSQPVREIRGVAHSDGFTVTMPGSLSLDRAGPIAASHALVERSMILNRGDRSELTIVFVEGQTPLYRVSARGAAIEVVIARR